MGSLISDYQANRLYLAERVLDEEKSITAIIDFFEYVVNDSWFKKKFPDCRPEINFVTCGGSYAEINRIVISLEHLMRSTVLHELAHIAGLKRVRWPYHGVSFCRRYLRLVRRYMGDDSYNKLKKSFRSCKVNF